MKKEESNQIVKQEFRTKALKNRISLYENKTLYSKSCAQIQQNILQSSFYKEAENICLYVSVKGELQTQDIIKMAWQEEKNVLFPLCHKSEKGLMDFALCSSEASLQKGKYDIPEPKADCPIFSPEKLNSSKTLILVPALAFDEKGFRVGYGGGFYDRYLIKIPNSLSIGLAFSEHIFPQVPRMSWDINVQYLATEKELKRIMYV